MKENNTKVEYGKIIINGKMIKQREKKERKNSK